MTAIIFTFGSGGRRDGEGNGRLRRHHKNIMIRYAINAKDMRTRLLYLAASFEDKGESVPEFKPKTDGLSDE
jgi:hypothetical protein